MARLFLALAAPTLAARVEVHSGLQSNSLSFGHLSEAESLQANDALDILAKLKENLDDAALQKQYREVIGEIEWEEDRALLLTGMDHDAAPVMLGEESKPGKTRLKLVELLAGRLGKLSWFTTRLGRFFTGRRDFAIEETDGDTKYTIDGITRSLHSRMQVSFPNEPNPRYVVRRAFNYLNPVASTVGQYMYRVVRCTDEIGGWAGGCVEGEILYTITKDRFGRGAMWGQDEFRVYQGTGGCSRHGYGVLSCRKQRQIMYSISSGLTSGKFSTTFYNGHIKAINGDHESGKLYDGTRLNADDLLGMQVATVEKIHGAPRPLNWPQQITEVAAAHALGQTVESAVHTGEILGEVIESIEHELEHGDELVQLVAGVALGSEDAIERADQLYNMIPQTHLDQLEQATEHTLEKAVFTAKIAKVTATLSFALHVARSLVWADSYAVAFNGGGGSADDLLVSIVAAVQDLTRENNVR